MGEDEESLGHVAGKRNGLLDGIDEDWERTRLRTRLHLKEALDRKEIKRIYAKAVEGIRGDGYDPSALDETRRVFDDFLLGRIR